jgi:hypothetical protein
MKLNKTDLIVRPTSLLRSWTAILCTFGLVLASRAVKERKIANLT